MSRVRNLSVRQGLSFFIYVPIGHADEKTASDDVAQSDRDQIVEKETGPRESL